jgi:hypothetical protein
VCLHICFVYAHSIQLACMIYMLSSLLSRWPRPSSINNNVALSRVASPPFFELLPVLRFFKAPPTVRAGRVLHTYYVWKNWYRSVGRVTRYVYGVPTLHWLDARGCGNCMLLCTIVIACSKLGTIVARRVRVHACSIDR